MDKDNMTLEDAQSYIEELELSIAQYRKGMLDLREKWYGLAWDRSQLAQAYRGYESGYHEGCSFTYEFCADEIKRLHHFYQD